MYENEKFINNNQEYKGENLNPNIVHGPVHPRGCHDIFCILLYGLFWFGLILIAGVALKSGDPKRLASPFDPNG